MKKTNTIILLLILFTVLLLYHLASREMTIDARQAPLSDDTISADISPTPDSSTSLESGKSQIGGEVEDAFSHVLSPQPDVISPPAILENTGHPPSATDPVTDDATPDARAEESSESKSFEGEIIPG